MRLCQASQTDSTCRQQEVFNLDTLNVRFPQAIVPAEESETGGGVGVMRAGPRAHPSDHQGWSV